MLENSSIQYSFEMLHSVYFFPLSDSKHTDIASRTYYFHYFAKIFATWNISFLEAFNSNANNVINPKRGNCCCIDRIASLVSVVTLGTLTLSNNFEMLFETIEIFHQICNAICETCIATGFVLLRSCSYPFLMNVLLFLKKNTEYVTAQQ